MVNDIILTPITIWKNFVIDDNFQESFISELSYDGIVFKNLYFSGREVGNEKVRIFATLAQNISVSSDNVIVLVGDPSEGINMDRIKFFTAMGYTVISPDLFGFSENTNFTKYPDLVSYANYDACKNELTRVKENVIKTPWYEWACVVRYSVAFAKKYLKAKNVALVGVHNGSNVCFMSVNNDIDCFVSVFGACIDNDYTADTDCSNGVKLLSDEGRRFFAGIQPESYCRHIKCPVLYLSATNNKGFDLLNACNALNYLQNEVYYNFSPRLRHYILKNGLVECEKFLSKYLGKNNDVYLYSTPELSINVKDGKIVLDVEIDEKQEDLEWVKLYTSSGEEKYYKKNWIRVSRETKKQYVLEEKNYSGKISAFVIAHYKDGSSVSSSVVEKKVNVLKKKAIPPIYSGTKSSSFASLNAYGYVLGGIFLQEERSVDVLAGPFGILGAYSPSGLITFKICESNELLSPSTILKFDLYCQTYSVGTIGLLVDENGETVQYNRVVTVNGGSVWQRVVESLDSFKTDEGKTLKNYKGVYAISFYSEEKFLLNNLILF